MQNLKDFGLSSKMTSSCKWPTAVLWDAKLNLPSTRIRIFFNPPIFLCGFKHSTSTRIRIHSQFVSEFVKRYWKILSPIFFNNCCTDKIVPPALFYGVHYCSKHFEHIFNFLTPFSRPGGHILLSGITSYKFTT